MKRIFAGLILVSVLAHASPTWGDLATGNEMLPACQQEGTEYWAAGYCVGAIQGIAMHANFHRDICLPDGVTAAQMRRVVVQFMEQHPEKLHKSFLSLALSGLLTGFPCPKRG